MTMYLFGAVVVLMLNFLENNTSIFPEQDA